MTDSIDNIDALVFIDNVYKHNIKNDSDFLISNMPLKDSINILDVGYGNGNLLLKIQNTTYKVNAYGVEKSQLLYEHSREQLLKSKVNIFCEDFENLSIDKQFDIIIMSFYLHHVDDFSKHLIKAFSMLNNNGIIIILDRIALNHEAKIEFTTYWEEYYSSEHEWHEECPSIFTREELINAAKNEGFTTEDFIIVPNDFRKGTEKFPKTLVIIKRLKRVLKR